MANNWHEVAVKYEEDHALFMLNSTFNQFPPTKIAAAYHKASGDFMGAMEILLQEQAETGTKPKVALKPKIPRQALVGKFELPPVKEETIMFKALDDNFDYEKVVQWKKFDMQDDRHLRLLKDTEDPISLDDLLEVGLSGKDDIVQLPCATKKLRCNFTKTSIIKSLQSKAQCPVCNHHYAIPGSQPTGSMDISVDKNVDCETYRGDGTIVLKFSFANGVQGQNHPSPGVAYTGATRIAYLPNVDDGKKALDLIAEAFKRGELFTIGTSLTNGTKNVLTYGSIHLKTNKTGGTSNHGWPDGGYFQRLRQECAEKMIFDKDKTKEMFANQMKGTNKII